ncbi:MAG: YebC/PmpR family DNA-binding transcriptional regulator [Saprospiraceae bacterium]|nr:YebC/PmpR family DNA-binding transcriptional regulator [Bacteroidia bacterium]NNE16708.1 YebC/PmpR family DNA-binding transcriptional regulator [Saprospiraceae bacterium]NNL93729.1 YebC/PmpR family DNA-binding transcriptional regulator [Saprospiraceae bacterium]
MGRAFEYRKATKFARWDKMAKQFSKASKHITIAVKQGGPDPDTNVLLRRAIQNAKSVQMPKDKIENAIKKAADKDTSNYEETVYEGMAPHGVAVVVEAATDNTQRTVANVRSYFRKKGGSLGTQGMHDFLFNRKGVFYIEKENIEDLEELELEMIDYGLESIEEDTVEEKDFYKLYVAFEDFGKMQEALEQKDINAEKSELERIPTITKELSDEQVDEVLALVDLMEQDDDVTNVFINLA